MATYNSIFLAADSIRLFEKEMAGIEQQFGFRPNKFGKSESFRNIWGSMSRSILREVAVRSEAVVWSPQETAVKDNWFIKDKSWIPSSRIITQEHMFLSWLESCIEKAKEQKELKGQVHMKSDSRFAMDHPFMSFTETIFSNIGPAAILCTILALGRHGFFLESYGLRSDSELDSNWNLVWESIPFAALLAHARLTLADIPISYIDGLYMVHINGRQLSALTDSEGLTSGGTVSRVLCVSVELTEKSLLALFSSGEEFTLPISNGIGLASAVVLYKSVDVKCDIRRVEGCNILETPEKESEKSIEFSIEKAAPEKKCSKFIPNQTVHNGIAKYHHFKNRARTCTHEKSYDDKYSLSEACVDEVTSWCLEKLSNDPNTYSITFCRNWLKNYDGGVVNHKGLAMASGICKKDMNNPICSVMCEVANRSGVPDYCESAFSEYRNSDRCKGSKECRNAILCRDSMPNSPQVAANKECWWWPCHDTEYHYLSDEVQKRMFKCRYELSYLSIDEVRLRKGAVLVLNSADESTPAVEEVSYVDRFPITGISTLVLFIVLLCLGLLIQRSYVEHVYAEKNHVIVRAPG